MKCSFAVTVAALVGLGHAFDLSMYDTTVTCNHPPIYNFTDLAEGGVCNDLGFDKPGAPEAPFTAEKTEGDCVLTTYGTADCSDKGWSPGSGCYYSGSRIFAASCQ